MVTGGHPAPSRAGQPLGSVDLGLAAGVGVRGDRRGGWLVSTAATLAAVTPEGRRRWQVPTLGAARGPVGLAGDGSVIRVEGDQVVARDLDSGGVLRSFPAPDGHWASLDPWGGLLYGEVSPGGRATLHRTTMTGDRRWSVALERPARLVSPPVALGDTVVVHHGGRLSALDRAGKVCWVAGHDGFHPRQAHWPEPAGVDELWAAPHPVGPTTLLVGLRWPTSHRRLFLVDPAARTVERYADAVVPKPPLAVVPRTAAGFRVAMPGPTYQVRRLEWQFSVVLLDQSGDRVWEHRLPAEPAGLVAGAEGTFIVSATPSRPRWDDYGHWQDLSPENYVRCLGPDGAERWTWHPPGPQSHLPWLGTDGVIYLGADGQLWALPAR